MSASKLKELERALKNGELNADEQRKIKELLQGREKKDEKVDFLYKNSRTDNEEYLLGKRIDKYYKDEDEQQNEPKNDSVAIGALFQDDNLAGRAKIDMGVKMREDPLYAIREREADARRKLLNNPVKMKQLQKVIEEKKSKEKKHKKKKKKSGKDEDDELLNKYLALMGKSKKQKSDSSDEDEVEHRKHDKKHKHKIKDSKRNKEQSELIEYESKHGNQHSKHEYSQSRRNRSPDSHRHKRRNSPDFRSKRHDSSSPDNRRKRHKSPDIRRKRHDSSSPGNRRKRSLSPDLKRQRHDSSSPDSRLKRRNNSDLRLKKHNLSSPNTKKTRHYSSSPEGSPTVHQDSSASDSSSEDEREQTQDKPKLQYGLIGGKKRSPGRAAPVYKPVKKVEPEPAKKPVQKRKLTEAEKEEKLREMMDNAKWRDDQRAENVKRYREEDSKEEDDLSTRTQSAADFVKPLMASHASQSSVEDRIKRNIYNVQKSKSSSGSVWRK